MATVDIQAPSAERVEATIRLLAEDWNDVAEYVRAWHEEWDEDDKLTFVVEAPIREMYFKDLQRWAEPGWLSEEEMCTYRELVPLVVKGREMLAPLLAED